MVVHTHRAPSYIKICHLRCPRGQSSTKPPPAILSSHSSSPACLRLRRYLPRRSKSPPRRRFRRRRRMTRPVHPCPSSRLRHFCRLCRRRPPPRFEAFASCQPHPRARASPAWTARHPRRAARDDAGAPSRAGCPLKWRRDDPPPSPPPLPPRFASPTHRVPPRRPPRPPRPPVTRFIRAIKLKRRSHN